jgi:hypothetical protein
MSLQEFQRPTEQTLQRTTLQTELAPVGVTSVGVTSVGVTSVCGGVSSIEPPQIELTPTEPPLTESPSTNTSKSSHFLQALLALSSNHNSICSRSVSGRRQSFVVVDTEEKGPSSSPTTRADVAGPFMSCPSFLIWFRVVRFKVEGISDRWFIF